MGSYHQIIAKLRGFIRKFYVNELLKGLILFFALGLLYFLLTVSLEYFLWLSKTGRLILFWLFIAVEAALFGRFIVLPILKLFNLSRGISHEKAAQIIGNHFPEVSDKLINVLQLKAAGEQANSDLLMASIEQKSNELQPIPFKFAINFKSNFKYLKFAALPILIILIIWGFGYSSLFTDSYSRVVNYKIAYEPPAPFSFHILNADLEARQNEDFVLQLKTEGEIIPENVKIHYHGESFLLESKTPGQFSYTFSHLDENIRFYFSANQVSSRPYLLKVNNIPILLDFKMHLDYPAYLGKKDQTIKGTGNATVPEGTKISWNIVAKNTTNIKLKLPDTLQSFTSHKNAFVADKVIRDHTYYKVLTSNKRFKDFMKLAYELKVIKDEYPEITVAMKRDSIRQEVLYFHGQLSDDYGLSGLQLVYYPVKQPHQIEKRSIPLASTGFEEFLYVFPDTLNLERGVSYELYFQVFDNDAINGSKSAKSQLFSYRRLSVEEAREKQLNEQHQGIEDIDQSLRQMKKSQDKLTELSQMQKQKSKLSYTDQQKFKRFFNRQQQQNEQLQNYFEKMQRNLEDFKRGEKDDMLKDKLQKRLERMEKQLQQNEKLLKELEKYRRKLSDEKLAEKLEQLAKNKKNQEMSLEQLLELTKRYYVRNKAKQLAKDLHQLAKKQQELSTKKEENTSEAQQKLNDAFEQYRKRLDSLQKENKALENPMDLGRKKAAEEKIEKDQKQAKKKLENSERQKKDAENEQKSNSSEQNSSKSSQQLKQGAQQKQQSAAEQMRQMSQQMMSMMQMSMMNRLDADIEMLKQILDNLIVFSFQQEDLMEDFSKLNKESPNYAEKLQYQYTLKNNFEHIDDSLYALALRNPFISDKILSQLTDINFNLDKSVSRLAEVKLRTGIASQHYVLTGANDLANLLDDALQNMQMMMQMKGSSGGQGMPKPGQGQGRGFQLPDIIKTQQSLAQQMKEGRKKFGKKGSQKDGQKPGEKGKEGKSGKKGQQMGNGQFSSGQKNARLYEIFKQQQKLRFELENLMRKKNLGEFAERLSRQMKQVEQELLRQGFTEQTEEMMMQIKQNLIRLKNATYKQEWENKRQSKTNFKIYNHDVKGDLETAKDYFNTLEILNRHRLPLQQNYKQLIQEYFKQ